MKILTFSLMIVSFYLFAIPIDGFGQEPTQGQTQETLQEIIVSANKVAQPENVVMAATTIIDKDTIRNSMSQSLIDLLSGQAGMQLTQAGGLGSQTSLFLRGTESDHTLILIDGIQITTSTGAAGRLEFIPLDQIERIEIIRGPRSSIHGSEAIGGVLNIITASSTESGFNGNFSVMAGTERSSNANLGLAASNETTTVSFNASHRETNGINAKESGSLDNDGFNNDTIALSLNHQFNDEIVFSSNYSRFNSAVDYDDGLLDVNSQQLAFGFSFTITDLWESNIRLERFDEDNNDKALFGTTLSHSENNKLLWHNVFKLNNISQLSFGADYLEQSLEYTSFGAVQTDTERNNNGIYGVYILNAALADLTLSLRNDDNERFGNHSTGSMALGKNFNQDFRGWLSYGTAFKAPNLIDLYVDFPAFSFFANPNLEPETSRNLEIGLQWQVLGAQWKLNAFRNDIDDLITTDATFTSLANTQKARINGVEASLDFVITDWNVKMDLTILDHENRLTKNELLRRPDQSLSLNLSKQIGDFDFIISSLTQSKHSDIDPITFGRSSVGGYTTANLVMAYRLDQNMKIRLRIANLFDKQYQIVDGFNTYGRTAQLSFDYQF